MTSLFTPYIKRSTKPKVLDIDAAKKLLDISAEKNRNLLIAFMAYLATVIILALSITDLDLLVDQKTIQLPLLSVGLPMWAFYTIIPFFLILLHFDVLQNVQEHNQKLDAWLAYKPVDAGSQLFPYILDFARVRYGRQAAPSLSAQLVAAGAWLMYVYLPLSVLALFFIRFADLQGVGIGVFHLVLGLADYFLLWQFWRKLRHQDLTVLNKSNRLNNIAHGVQIVAVAWVFGLWACIQVLHFWQAWFEESTPETRIVRYGIPPIELVNTVEFALKIESTIVKNIANIAIVPRLSAPNAIPFRVSEDDIRLAKWHEPHKQDSELWRSTSPAIDLSNRRLAFANLENAQLRRADLSFADLQSANLQKAQLQDSNLDYATFRSANLYAADLSGASGFKVQMQGSDLSKTKLMGVDFINAQMQFSDFAGSNLRGANLFLAQMQAAHFQFATLNGANLTLASLEGAQGGFTTMEGANLTETNVKNAQKYFFIDETGWFKKMNYDETIVFYNFRDLMIRSSSAPFAYLGKKQSNTISDNDVFPVLSIEQFRKMWLSTLCYDKSSTRMQLIRIVERLEKIAVDELNTDYLIDVNDLKKYIYSDPRCKPYQAMAAEIFKD